MERKRDATEITVLCVTYILPCQSRGTREMVGRGLVYTVNTELLNCPHKCISLRHLHDTHTRTHTHKLINLFI